MTSGPLPIFRDPFQSDQYRRGSASAASKRLSQNSYCWDRSSFDLDNDETEKVPYISEEARLPPQDGGKRAWMVLIAGFIVQAILVGLPRAYGCFQEYYLNTSEYKDDTRIVMIGTLAISIPDLGAPLMTWFVARYPRHRIAMMWPGFLLCIGGLVGASYAPNIQVLIVTQGLMYGLGGLIVFYPMLSLISEWWDVRIGLAYGVLDCSWGFIGAPLPFLLSWLLDQYGSRVTLRILAVTCGVITLPALILIHGRIPRAQLPSKAVKQSYGFVKNPLFHVYIWSTFFQGLAYFIPSLFVPSYVEDVKFKIFPAADKSPDAIAKAIRSTSDLLLALFAVASIPSALLMGWLSDKHNLLSLPFLAILSALATTLATTLLWGYVRNLYALIPFAILFSFFGSGWEVLWGRMSLAVIPVHQPEREEPAPDIEGRCTAQAAAAPMLVYALLNFARGVSEIVAGAAGSKLLLAAPAIKPLAFGAGRYLSLIVWTSTGLGLALLICLVWWILPSRITKKYDAVYATQEEVLIIQANGRICTEVRSRANTMGLGYGVRSRRFTTVSATEGSAPVSPMRAVDPIPIRLSIDTAPMPGTVDENGWK